MIYFALVLALAAGAPTPEKAVEGFFKSFDDGRYQDAWNMISPSSASYLENVLGAINDMASKYSTKPTTSPKGGAILEGFGKDIVGKISLMPDSILGSVTKGDRGYVVVEYNLERIMNQAMGGSSSSEAMMAKSFLSQLPSKTIVWTWETDKTKDGWQFNLGIINMGVSLFTNIFGSIAPMLEKSIPVETPAEVVPKTITPETSK